MTYTKQLTGAAALLASIAVLDNFIFVELEPGPESMVLIEPSAPAGMDENTQSSEHSSQPSAAGKFWVDQHRVSIAEFENFLEATDYQPQEFIHGNQQAGSNQNGNSAYIAVDDKWRAQVSSANWNEAHEMPGQPMNHTLEGENDFKVSFKDALAYCNWLGKELPTAKQSEHLYSQAHEQNAGGVIEFRCAKNF